MYYLVIQHASISIPPRQWQCPLPREIDAHAPRRETEREMWRKEIEHAIEQTRYGM